MKQIHSRGILYSGGIVFNRIVPEWIMRFRIFRVWELAANSPPGDQPATDSGFRTDWCSNRQQYQQAQLLTQYTGGQNTAGQHTTGHDVSGDPANDVLADTTCRRPHAAMLVWDGQQPIGAGWLAEESFSEPELGLRYRLAEDQAWVFAAQVAKPHRGRGAYRCLLAAVLGGRPEKSKFAAINPTNRASMNAHRSSTVRVLGSCVTLRVFGMVVCLTTGEVKSDGCFRWNCRNHPIEVHWASLRPN